MFRRVDWFLLCFVASTIAACGDDDGGTTPPPPPPPPADTGTPPPPPVDTGPRDSGPPPDAGPAREDIAFDVVRFLGDAPAAGAPAAGATVAMELPDGTTAETTADAMGHVTFDDVDLSSGAPVFTAYLEGHTPTTVYGTEYFEDVPLPVYASSTDTVTLRGTAAGMMDEAHRLNVHPSTTSVGSFDNIGPTWSLRASRGVPLQLIALEYSLMMTADGGTDLDIVAWTMTDEVPASADATVPIDFGDMSRRLATHDVMGAQFTITVAADSPLVTRGGARVLVFDRDADGRLVGPIGSQTHIRTLSGTSTVELDVQYADVPGLTHDDAITRYIVESGPVFSIASLEGLPEPGMADPDFLDPPSITTGDFSLDGGEVTIDFPELPPDGFAQIFLRRADGHLVWFLSTRRATSPVTFRIPALPSTADRSALLGTDSLDAVPNVCVIDAASQPGFCSRVAGGRAVRATP